MVKRLSIIIIIVLTCTCLFTMQGCIAKTGDNPVLHNSSSTISKPFNSNDAETTAIMTPEVQSTPSVTPDDASIAQSATSANLTTEITLVQPELLTKYVVNTGLSFDDFDFSQLIMVVAVESNAKVYCYDKTKDGQWRLNEDIGIIDGHVGKNGVSAQKKEGDGCTPTGLFQLGLAFGINAKPDTDLEYREVTEKSYWIDDPESSHYNEWVEGNGESDWNSAEKLSEHKNYSYAIVIDYNMNPVVPYKGSAIFFHCGDAPTAGCVSTPENKVLEILKWLKPNSSAHILIVTNE